MSVIFLLEMEKFYTISHINLKWPVYLSSLHKLKINISLTIIIDILEERSGFQHKGDFQGWVQREDG